MIPSRTFLVVDDEESNRFLIGRALKKAFAGCEVIECETSDAAIQAASNSIFDAVLTDHHLIDGDAPALISQLRARGVGCPVIVLTGSEDPKDHQQAYIAGATHVISGSRFDFVSYLHRILP